MENTAINTADATLLSTKYVFAFLHRKKLIRTRKIVAHNFFLLGFFGVLAASFPVVLLATELLLSGFSLPAARWKSNSITRGNFQQFGGNVQTLV